MEVFTVAAPGPCVVQIEAKMNFTVQFLFEMVLTSHTIADPISCPGDPFTQCVYTKVLNLQGLTISYTGAVVAIVTATE